MCVCVCVRERATSPYEIAFRRVPVLLLRLCVHVCVYVCVREKEQSRPHDMGWLWLVGSIQL